VPFPVLPKLSLRRFVSNGCCNRHPSTSVGAGSARIKQVPPLRRIIREANDPAPVGMTDGGTVESRALSNPVIAEPFPKSRSCMSRWFPPFPKPGKDGAPSAVALRSRSKASDKSVRPTQACPTHTSVSDSRHVRLLFVL
jgi:hypothetical protein